MKCAVHSDVDAAGFCRNCGKALCDACSRAVHGALYCEECLARVVTGPSPVPEPPKPGTPNPGAAAALGFIPGLGAVYNGEYIKGLIHVMIFAGLIAMLSSNSVNAGMEAMGGVFLGIFYFYMPIEAYRTARAKQMGQPVPSFFSDPAVTAPPATQAGFAGEPGAPAPESAPPQSYGFPTGAVILLIIGVLFLLGNFNLLNGIWVDRLWPLAIIAVGVWLIWKRAR